MAQVPQATSTSGLHLEAGMQVQNVEPWDWWELSTFYQSGGYQGPGEFLYQDFNPPFEVDMGRDQSSVLWDHAGTTQHQPAIISLNPADILSEIRQLRLQVLFLQQAVSHLWPAQQPWCWDYVPDVPDHTTPNYIDAHAQAEFDSIWSSK